MARPSILAAVTGRAPTTLTAFTSLDAAPVRKRLDDLYSTTARVETATGDYAAGNAAIAAAERRLGVAELAEDPERIAEARAALEAARAALATAQRRAAAGPEAIDEARKRLAAADLDLRQRYADAARPHVAAAEDRVRRAAAELSAALRLLDVLQHGPGGPVSLPVPSNLYDERDPLPAADQAIAVAGEAVRDALARSMRALTR